MFFSVGRIILCALLIVQIVGCAKEGESQDQPIVVQPKTGAGTCLSSFSEHFERYTQGKMSQRQVNGFWNCISGAINEFTQITTGDVGGNYSPEAIWTFLHKYFLVNQRIDSNLLMSFMEIKRVLIGGTINRVTKNELLALSQFVDLLRLVSLDLNSHITIVVHSKVGATAEEVVSANIAVERALTRLGQWLVSRGQSYDFSKLQALVDGLAAASEDPDSWKSIQENVEVLAKAKSITVGLPIETIVSHQWQPLMRVLSEASGLILNWKYGHAPGVIDSFAKPVMKDSLARVAKILENGVLARENTQTSLALKEFDELFLLLESHEWLGKDVKAESLTKAFRWLVARLLSRPSLNSPVGEVLTIEHLVVLKNYLNDWKEVSAFVSKWPGDSSLQPRVNDFKQVLESAWDLVLDEHGRLTFESDRVFDISSLQVLAWQFMGISWLKESYLAAGIEEMGRDEMMLAVGEVLPLIQSFGFLLETELEVYKRLIVWADLFMPSSDGNKLVHAHEATHFLSFLVSSYRAGNIWLEESKNACGELADSQCARDTLWIQRDLIFRSMPGLANHANHKSLEEWQVFTKKVEKTALGEIQTVAWTSGDTVLYFMLVHYLETFVKRFDSSENGSIDLAESLVAFPVFKLNIESLGVPEYNVEPFFTFLLKYGEKHFNRYGGLTEFQYWKRHRELWVYESNRDMLINILYELNKP